METSSRAARKLPRLRREHSIMRTEITDALRRRIIDGTLVPGTRIAEEWVSREMEVSRGPVREALRLLENEGLLVVHPHRGAVVSAISPEELRDVLIPIRFILERQACLRTLGDLGPEDFGALSGLVDQMQSVATRGGDDALATLVDLDVAFHHRLTQRGEQYHTLQLWRTIQPRIRVGFFQLGSLHRDLGEIVLEHRTLVEALETRDPRVVERELEVHICTTQLALLARLTDPPAGSDELAGP